MTPEDETQAGFAEFSPSVLIGLFLISTIGSVGSILFLGEFTPTPPGAVEKALAQYLDWIVIAVVALITAKGVDFLSEYLTEQSRMDVDVYSGGSTVYSIIILSMILVTFWNVSIFLAEPIAEPIGTSLLSYQSPQFIVWTLAIKFSLDIIFPVAAIGLIISVLVLFLRLLFDIIIFIMDSDIVKDN